MNSKEEEPPSEEDDAFGEPGAVESGVPSSGGSDTPALSETTAAAGLGAGRDSLVILWEEEEEKLTSWRPVC